MLFFFKSCKKNLQCLQVGILYFLGAMFAFGQTQNASATSEYILDNGLKLIIREDRRAPIVVTMILYKVGSVDESRGQSGLSHMLEHMMFKGTSSLKTNEYSEIITSLGGEDNAFTTRDYTAYFTILPSRELETGLRLESDRMQNLALTEEDLLYERKVVSEERMQTVDNNSKGLFVESFHTMLWATNAYRNPVIGWLADIQNWTLLDIQSWYDQYYYPNNAVLVIVGDVNSKNTYELVNKYFGIIDQGPDIIRKANFEVPQNHIKYIETSAFTNQSVILMGYKVPSINSVIDSKDALSLLLISEILAGSKTAYLPKKMIKTAQYASDISVFYDENARYDTSFIVQIIPVDGVDLLELEGLVKQEVMNLQSALVSQEELDKVVEMYRIGQIYNKDSVYLQAINLGAYELTGQGWENRENLVSNLKRITPQDVQNAAQKYFNDNNLTVGFYYGHPEYLENEN